MFSISVCVYAFYSGIDTVWDWWARLQSIGSTTERQFWWCKRDFISRSSILSFKTKRRFSFQTIAYVTNTLDEATDDSEDLIRHIQTIFQLFVQLLTNIHQKSLETDEYCLSHLEHALCHALYFLNKATASSLLHRYMPFQLYYRNEAFSNFDMIFLDVFVLHICSVMMTSKDYWIPCKWRSSMLPPRPNARLMNQNCAVMVLPQETSLQPRYSSSLFPFHLQFWLNWLDWDRCKVT